MKCLQRFTSLRSKIQFDMHSGSQGKGHQGIQTESLPLAAHQIRYTGLPNAKHLGSLLLGQAFEVNFPKSMQNVHSIIKLGDIDHAPCSFHMNVFDGRR